MLARPGADRARAAVGNWTRLARPKPKPASGESDDDATADDGDGADHGDNGDVLTTEYLAHVCLSPQYYDDNGYDGVAFDIDGHHDKGRVFVSGFAGIPCASPGPVISISPICNGTRGERVSARGGGPRRTRVGPSYRGRFC